MSSESRNQLLDAPSDEASPLLGGATVAVRLSPKQKRRSVIVMAFIWFFTGVEYAVILPTVWQFLQHNHADHKWWLSATVSAFSVANLLLSPFFGRAADLYSTKTILTISNVFEIGANILYFMATDPYTIVAARFIAGMGAAAGAAIFAYVGRVSTSNEEINNTIGGIMATRAMGLLIGPAFNFALVHVDVKAGAKEITSLNVPGLLMAFFWIVAQIMVHFFFTDIPVLPKGEGSIQKVEEGEAKKEAPKTRITDYLTWPIVALIFVQFLQMFNQTAYETWITPFTQKVFHWKELPNSMVYMTTAIIGLLTYIGIVIVTKKHPIQDRVQIMIGVLLQVAAFFLFWFLPAENHHPDSDKSNNINSDQIWKFAISSGLFVIGLPFVYIATALQAKLTTENAQGRGQGICRSAVSLAQIIGPFWASLSTHENAYWGGIIGFTVLSIIILVIIWKQLIPVRTFGNKAPAPSLSH